MEPDWQGSGYPEEIGKIIIGSCAVTGCHNNQSKDAVAGLSLETWEKMMEGGRGGACVIPYRPDYSTLLYYINTYSDLGLTLKPTMPFRNSPLSRTDVSLIKDWILKGAPNYNGFVKFSDNPSREKIYLANQGCDVVAIFDAQSNIVMRYIDVGIKPEIEAPHMVKVSPDNQYWYVVFYNSSVIQKFRTSDNTLVGSINITDGLWNTITITSDSKKAFVVEWQSNGRIAYVDLEKMALVEIWNGLAYPHGSAINKTDDTVYVTGQTGNFIYKIPVNDFLGKQQVSLNPPNAVSSVSSLDPHDILFNQDYSKYYITCEKSNEVRVMQTAGDKLLAVIPTAQFPVEMSMSSSMPYLFVSCMEDTSINPKQHGQIAVINTNTNTVIKYIYSGHQPHDISVDDVHKRVYVGNRNATGGGPAPHHSSVCNGRNGYVTIIDMNTLELLPGFKTEVSVDPYSFSTAN